LFKWLPGEITVKAACPTWVRKGAQVTKTKPPIQQPVKALVVIALEAPIAGFTAFVGMVISEPATFRFLRFKQFMNDVNDRRHARIRLAKPGTKTCSVDMSINDLEKGKEAFGFTE
jgi:hypothetical protein